MAKKKPQKPDSHKNDERAHSSLRSVFPDCNIVSPKDTLSGYEYGQDWLIQLMDKNGVSGAEFRVQSKVFTTQKQTQGRRLGAKIKVTTLNYLAELPQRVLLHYYDHIHQVGYWMWLDEWYEQNYSPEWEQKAEVRVNIPKKNILDSSAARRIKSSVLNHHRRQLLQKTAALRTKIDQNYGYSFFDHENGYGVAVYAKHEKSLEDQPISINFTLGQEVADTFQQVLETGISAEFPALQLDINDPLDWCREDMTFTGGATVTVIPLVPDESFPLKIEYLNDDEENVLTMPYIQMKLVRSGTKVREWRGQFLNLHLEFVIIFDERAKAPTFRMRFIGDWQDPSVLWNCVETLEKLSDTTIVKFTNLESQQTVTARGCSFDGPAMPPENRRLVSALATIARKLNVLIPVPERFSMGQLVHAEKIAEILNTGITSEITIMPNEIIGHPGTQPTVFIAADDEILRSIHEDFHENGFVNIALPGEREGTAEVFGHNLSLGNAQQIICGEEIDRGEKVREYLLGQGVDEDKVESFVAVRVDMEKSYVVFENWYTEDTEMDEETT